jgi:S-formylglutathione hydrolase FrmB
MTRKAPIRLLALAVATLVLAGCGAAAHGAGSPTTGSHDAGKVRVVRYVLRSHLLGRDTTQWAMVAPNLPKHPPLLLLLHGRSRTGAAWTNSTMAHLLSGVGRDAPVVIGVDGGDHSYYHDRADGKWASYVVKDVIPDAVQRFHVDAHRIAIGGHSMGGYGAYDIALHFPNVFCAVGAHEPAIWQSGGETAAGAFDDAADFDRNNVIAMAGASAHAFGKARLWLDFGQQDFFVAGDQAFAGAVRGTGASIQVHTAPGTHGMRYVWANFAPALRFYVDSLKHCR